MRVLVVLPTYNEAENIDHVLRAIRAALPDAGVLVVDDGSPDGTADLAEKLGARARAASTSCAGRAKSGLGSAYRAGFAWGLERGWEAFVEMDADLSHDPRRSRAWSAPLSRRRRPGGRVALRPGRLDPELALAPAAAVPGRQHLRRAAARPARHGLDVGVPGLPGRDPAPHRPRRGAGRGLRLPDRDGPPGPRARRAGRSRCRSGSWTGSRASPRCRCTSWSRLCSS